MSTKIIIEIVYPPTSLCPSKVHREEKIVNTSESSVDEMFEMFGGMLKSLGYSDENVNEYLNKSPK